MIHDTSSNTTPRHHFTSTKHIHKIATMYDVRFQIGTGFPATTQHMISSDKQSRYGHDSWYICTIFSLK